MTECRNLPCGAPALFPGPLKSYISRGSAFEVASERGLARVCLESCLPRRPGDKTLSLPTRFDSGFFLCGYCIVHNGGQGSDRVRG